MDGNNILIRSIKAAERTGMEADGVSTGALLLFVNSLSRYARELQPTRLIVCFDGGRSKYRLSIYDQYKSRRASHEGRDHPESAFGLAKRFLTLVNIPYVEIEGVEADDLIAFYWRNKLEDDRMFIVSGDHDFFQLLGDWTVQIDPGDHESWDAQRVERVLGCKPSNLPLVMALTGDKGDDIPGVPGIGTKTAVKMLARNNWDLGRTIAVEPKLHMKANKIMRNLSLVDLRTGYFSTKQSLSEPRPPLFDPETKMGGPLSNFLTQYQLSSVMERLRDGRLWTVGTPD